jgi:microsomal dipeptidase-like Zn-dependent dipeptidase
MERSASLPGHAPLTLLIVLILGLPGLACDEEPPGTPPERPLPPENDGIHGFANGCYVMDAAEPGDVSAWYLQANETGDAFRFAGEDEGAASRFLMRASDLATYLFYDTEGHYLIAEADGEGVHGLHRSAELLSDTLLNDDSYLSPAEWVLEDYPGQDGRFRLRHFRTLEFLTLAGLTPDEAAAAVITFYPSTGCAEFPELTIDAEGTVEPRRWEDGDVFGFVETHSHPFTNFSFGGGGIFHGAPYHRLGVEHALPSCEVFHGEEGRQDLLGYVYHGGYNDLDVPELLSIVADGELPEPNHATDGYPEFTDWPNAWGSSTHQTMYYRWIERAYLSGMRLLVDYATGNSVLCDLITGLAFQAPRYSCNDMVSVDRILEESRALERYVDAQHGGPGQGWFRIVESPEEARQVIDEGKLAVVLGIEISNVFDCFLTPPEGAPVCDLAHVQEQLDTYHGLGVRALFPNHKFDNAFTAGDGQRGVMELANLINSGYYSNYVEDCPDTPWRGDDGGVSFGGLNQPRDVYQMDEPPLDMSGFAEDPILTLTPLLFQFTEPSLEGDYCQNAGLTPLGEQLFDELMIRGMLIDIAHLPRRSVVRAMELFDESDYPGLSTHGDNVGGQIYHTGGRSNAGFGRCADPDNPGAMSQGYADRIEQIIENGGYPAEGFGFDNNGFAGGPRPRFGDDSSCSSEQLNPVSYPFESFAGDITFTEPRLGDRVVDFNYEGMIHIGLLPELIQDTRLDGMSDDSLEALFRSAEGYIRMWERAEARAEALQ